jgi:hypothetical protein
MKWIFRTPNFRRVMDTFRTLKTVYSTDEVKVYDINPGENKYVLKRLAVPAQDHDGKLSQFFREIENGMQPGLRKGSHVRIHAFFISPDLTSGMYIMDHASFGDPGIARTMTAHKYMKSEYFDDKDFRTKLDAALDRFYRVFRGFHGDLHASNVVVNLTAQNKIKNVVIIDYANIFPFDNHNKNKYVAKNINRTFAAIPYNVYDEYPLYSDIQVKWVPMKTKLPGHIILSNKVKTRTIVGKVPVRSNANMLRKLNNWSKVAEKRT